MKTNLLLIPLLIGQVLLGENLPVIIVNANQESSSTEVSASKINRIQIDNSLQGNGFISSLLDKNPNITVSDKSKNSTTAGEIAPGRISINEAPFYQNNFQIDGISNNSLLDPNLSNSFDPYDVPGNENEIFLDLDLIDTIKVYDSNISAEYGNFTGGVIDVKTVRPGIKPSYKVSLGYTNDELTKFHVSNEEVFQSAISDKYQPRFEKVFFSMYANTPINDENGLIFSYNRKQSTIPGAYFGGFRDKERLNESIFVKWSHYNKDDSVVDVSFSHSPYESTHFQDYIKDSDTTITGGGSSLKLNYEKDFDFWSFNSNLALKYSENSKDSLNYNKQWIKSSTKEWGEDNKTGTSYSNEGGSGNIEKTQKGINYNLKVNSGAYDTGDITHKFKSGFSLNFNNASYDRNENTYYYNNAKLEAYVDCNGNNYSCVDKEQYFSQRRVYQKEDISVSMLSTSYYLEDKLEYKYFEFTPGLRLDYNNYLNNVDLSYRLNSSIKPFGDKSTVIYAGFNRYYGKSFLGYKLREARLPYYDQYSSTSGNILTDWGSSADKDSSKYVFSNLDTPYTNEASLGIKQDFFGMRVNLKYVKRDAKSKFTKEYGDYTVYTMPDGVTKAYYKPAYFTNNGYSESEILSLNISPSEAVKFNTFNLGYSLSTSWKKTNSNIDNYDDVLDDEDTNDTGLIYYNGEYYDKDNLPIEANPKNINLHLNMAFKTLDIFGIPTRINLNNVIRYSLAYSQITASSADTVIYKQTLPDGSSQEYDVEVYEKYDYKDALTLDLKASFDFKISKRQNFIFTTEVTNVFDKVQNVQSSKSKYKTGRQFWFNAAYKF